jgi:predicted nucleotidyltransferase
VVASEADLIEKIDDFVRRLRRAIDVEAVILYGSQAKNTARESSDIDLAVVSPDFEGTSTYDRQEAVARATVGRAYRLSPIAFASSEYHNPGAHSFLREIIRTGRVVYPKPEA